MNETERVLVCLYLAQHKLIQQPSNFVPLTLAGQLAAANVLRNCGVDPDTLTPEVARGLIGHVH